MTRQLPMIDLVHLPKVTWVFCDGVVTAIPHDPAMEPVVFYKAKILASKAVPVAHEGWYYAHDNSRVYPRDADWMFEMANCVVTFLHECDHPEPDQCGSGDYHVKDVFT